MLLHQQIFFTTLAVAFAVLHFILYLYNRRSANNLYFALFALFYAASIFLDYQVLLAVDDLQKILLLRGHRGVLPCSTLFALLFVYSLSDLRIPRQFWFIAGGLLITGILGVMNPIKNFNLLQVVLLAVIVEAARLTVVGIRQRRDGLWLIVVGFAFLWVFSSYDMLMDFGLISPVKEIHHGYPFGFLGLLVFMSAYLARDIARANRQLQEYSHTLEERVEDRTRELKEAQNRLILKEKMASLGNLVAGVAHEINNPMGAVHSAADVTRRCIQKMRGVLPDKEDEVRQALDKYIKILDENNQVTSTASERITQIVRSLKSFARLDEASFQKADIHSELDSTLTLIHHETKDRISVRRHYGEIPEIDCFPNQLNQVFMNVLMNAVQAIPGEGEITISTSAEEDGVVIDISDNGCGIPGENLDKIFDPGFTTRGVGVGTELGLAISYNIIQKHGGAIQVESEKEKGTKVSIHLPFSKGC